MLVDLIVSPIISLLHAIFSVLPLSSVAAIFASVHSTAVTVGQWLAPWNTWLPLSELIGMLVLVVGVWLPAMALYVSANWVWRHIPDVFGFGPGAG